MRRTTNDALDRLNKNISRHYLLIVAIMQLKSLPDPCIRRITEMWLWFGDGMAKELFTLGHDAWRDIEFDREEIIH